MKAKNSVTIDNNKYGKLTVNLDDHNFDYQGIDLQVKFHTSNYNDACLEFKNKGNKSIEYYHIRKNTNNEYDIIKKIESNQEYIEILPLNDDYWLIKKHCFSRQNYQGIELSAIYSVKKEQRITNYFTEIQLKDGSEHRIYFQYEILAFNTDYETDNKIHFTTLHGYMDSEGNFSSEIYDEESQTLYGNNQFGLNSLSEKFENELNLIKRAYMLKYIKIKENAKRVIEELYENLNSNPPVEQHQITKILNFESRKNG